MKDFLLDLARMLGVGLPVTLPCFFLCFFLFFWLTLRLRPRNGWELLGSVVVASMFVALFVVLVASIFGATKSRWAHDVFTFANLGCCTGFFYGWLSIKGQAIRKANQERAAVEAGRG